MQEFYALCTVCIYNKLLIGIVNPHDEALLLCPSVDLEGDVDGVLAARERHEALVRGQSAAGQEEVGVGLSAVVGVAVVCLRYLYRGAREEPIVWKLRELKLKSFWPRFP